MSAQNTAIIVLLFGAILTGFGTITNHLNDKLDETQKLVYDLDKAMAVAQQESSLLKSQNESLQNKVDKLLEEQRSKRRD
ncbi:hypothetical protein [uncultured Photobacterium sp.]|uniref:hypothetical protein n=1 Tax=uncultured Photobacterium sp. TaxID=173973 RepID=UPI002636C1E0|nr:hypothetical protein [uncultured Photobacterium sp.]